MRNREITQSDGGSPITHYEYRQSADGGTTWQPDWDRGEVDDDEDRGGNEA